MASKESVGKVRKKYLEDVVLRRLGAKRGEVLVGPKHGVDNAVVRTGEGSVMIVTTDPLSIIPPLGLEVSAWLSVHLLASDFATSGIAPMYAIVDYNLPPSIKWNDFSAYWKATHEELQKLGVAVVAGHTGKYEGCNLTIVGGGVLLGFGSEDRYVTSSMARPGDTVMVTKAAAIAATGILARVFPKTVESNLDTDILKRAQELLTRFSTYKDGLTASSYGVREEGVTAMHDATEGGVLGALWEMASASGCGIEVEWRRIPVFDESRKICDLFKIDPYRALGEGSMMIAARPQHAGRVALALQAEGIECTLVGRMLEADEGMWLVDDGKRQPFTYGDVDPYWAAFSEASRKGWR